MKLMIYINFDNNCSIDLHIIIIIEVINVKEYVIGCKLQQKN